MPASASLNAKYTAHLFLILLALLIIAAIIPLSGQLFEPDSALYAVISKHMALNNNFVNLYANGGDWLDKPHLPFWLTAISFKIFGINAFAYKLPSFLCSLLGLRCLFLFTKSLLSPHSAYIACIIYFSSLHFLLSSYDVRAEIYLASFTIAAVYHIYSAHYSTAPRHIIAAAVFTAAAILTKGIFILIPLLGGFVYWWLRTHQLYQLIKPRWYLYLLLTAIFTAPELICLYLQFDSQPQKLIFNQHNVSGIKFFLWDSQFGRFFNTGPIKGHGDKLFFIHTTLWAFLPWSPLLIAAIALMFTKSRSRTPGHQLSIVTGISAIAFLLFSFSGFQLPHYIVLLLPFFSIIAAWLLASINVKQKVLAAAITTYIIAVTLLLLIILANYMAPGRSATLITITLAACIIAVMAIKRYIRKNSLYINSTIFALALSLYFTAFFYPFLLQYQSGQQAAYHANTAYSGAPVYMLNSHASYSLEFYAKAPVIRVQQLTAIPPGPHIIYLPKPLADSLARHTPVTVLKPFPYYRITLLRGRFINPATRPAAVDTFVLARFTPAPLK